MKNLFGFNKITQKLNGESFVLRSVDEAQQRVLEANEENGYELDKKASLPLWLTIVKTVLFCFFIIVLVSTIGAGFSKAWKNASALIVAAGVSGPAALALFLLGKAREKKFAPEAEKLLEKLSETEEASKKILRIPDDAAQTDVLTFLYKEKNGKLKLDTSPFAAYLLASTHAFSENGKLCFSDLNDVYGIDISEIVSIESNKKKISALGWNKAAPPNDKYFKKYKITVNQFAAVFMRPIVLTFRHGEENFEILFPPYEEETIRRLCNFPFPKP